MGHMDWGSELLGLGNAQAPEPDVDPLDTRPFTPYTPPGVAYEDEPLPPLPDFRQMQIERQLERDSLLFAAQRNRPQPPVPPSIWDDKPLPPPIHPRSQAAKQAKRSLWTRLRDAVHAFVIELRAEEEWQL